MDPKLEFDPPSAAALTSFLSLSLSPLKKPDERKETERPFSATEALAHASWTAEFEMLEKQLNT